MELKPDSYPYHYVMLLSLLIVPYGIETSVKPDTGTRHDTFNRTLWN